MAETGSFVEKIKDSMSLILLILYFCCSIAFSYYVRTKDKERSHKAFYIDSVYVSLYYDKLMLHTSKDCPNIFGRIRKEHIDSVINFLYDPVFDYDYIMDALYCCDSCFTEQKKITVTAKVSIKVLHNISPHE